MTCMPIYTHSCVRLKIIKPDLYVTVLDHIHKQTQYTVTPNNINDISPALTRSDGQELLHFLSLALASLISFLASYCIHSGSSSEGFNPLSQLLFCEEFPSVSVRKAAVAALKTNAAKFTIYIQQCHFGYEWLHSRGTHTRTKTHVPPTNCSFSALMSGTDITSPDHRGQQEEEEKKNEMVRTWRQRAPSSGPILTDCLSE